MDTIISWWLRKTALKKSNWNAPKEENSPIQEENTRISEPLPPWAFPSWYESSWSDLLTSEPKNDPEELPQAQIRESISFLVAFTGPRTPPDATE